MGGSADKKQQESLLLMGIIKSTNNGGRKLTATTTPSSSWKMNNSNNSYLLSMNNNSCVSARKIGANLWELFQPPPPHFNFNHHHGDGGRSHQPRRGRYDKDKEATVVSDDHPPPDPPGLETSLRSNNRELPSLRHLSVGRNGQDLHHVSSASCCSSMQVTPYACDVTPTHYTLKTSTHLLKVLNRIWNLEEKHASNVALIKSLKRDLDISQAQIKTLVDERKRDHQEIDELKQSTHERKKKVVQSTRVDEILDIKSSFMRERKARILLESLCDEFAKGIRDYEQKVRFLQQNRGEKDQSVSKNKPDRLILHVSEAWLDERAQMKCFMSEKASISDNLCCEIETFLNAKKKQSQGFGVENKEIEGDGLCGVINEPSSLLVSRMIDRDRGPAAPPADSIPRIAGKGPGAAEPSTKPMSRMTDQGPGVTEASFRRAREGVSKNTLMAKLVEARLESQFSKSRTLRR